MSSLVRMPNEYLQSDDERQVPPILAANPWLSEVEDTANTMTEILPPVVEVIQGIVVEGAKIVIGAGSKSYKTWLAILIALAIAHGVPVLDRATTRRRVLFINLELKPATFKRRIQTIANAIGIPVESALVLSSILARENRWS
jgi:RecA-family ATPase